MYNLYQVVSDGTTNHEDFISTLSTSDRQQAQDRLENYASAKCNRLYLTEYDHSEDVFTLNGLCDWGLRIFVARQEGGTA